MGTPTRTTNHAGGIEVRLSNGAAHRGARRLQADLDRPRALRSVDLATGEEVVGSHSAPDTRQVAPGAVIAEAEGLVLADALDHGRAQAEMRRNLPLTWRLWGKRGRVSPRPRPRRAAGSCNEGRSSAAGRLRSSSRHRRPGSSSVKDERFSIGFLHRRRVRIPAHGDRGAADALNGRAVVSLRGAAATDAVRDLLVGHTVVHWTPRAHDELVRRTASQDSSPGLARHRPRRDVATLRRNANPTAATPTSPPGPAETPPPPFSPT